MNYSYGNQPRLLVYRDFYLTPGELDEIKAKFLERYPVFKATFSYSESIWRPVTPEDDASYQFWIRPYSPSYSFERDAGIPPQPRDLSEFLALCDITKQTTAAAGSASYRKQDGVWETLVTVSESRDVSHEDALLMFNGLPTEWDPERIPGKKTSDLLDEARRIGLETQVSASLRIIAPWVFYASNEGGAR